MPTIVIPVPDSIKITGVDANGNTSVIKATGGAINVGTISVASASSSPLAANATYTGTWESTLGATVVLINTASNVPSATGGWQVQWSIDGSGLFFSQSLSQTGTARSMSFSIRAPWFRFVYVNGATLQSTFSLQCMFFSSSDALVTQLLSQAATEDSVAPPVRAFIAGKDNAVSPPVFRNLSIVDLGGGVWALNVSGSVAISNLPATQPVSGTFYQATQPVSGTVAVSGTIPVSLATAPTTPVTGTFYQATQPISAASLPLPSGAALEAGNLATLVATVATQATAAAIAALLGGGLPKTLTSAGNLSVDVSGFMESLTVNREILASLKRIEWQLSQITEETAEE